jgi:hypothetical protein
MIDIDPDEARRAAFRRLRDLGVENFSKRAPALGDRGAYLALGMAFDLAALRAPNHQENKQ